ncbi:helix-turn-helix domain-containing protein [Streptococcus mitis]|uniref:helix-turn-helix domain-containing protein n=1 Tax=Streptococcus mitis TaxID=28037 RepID=UPI001D1773A3|nr:helix-turn-helix transcriptional regulator [Streptococcus mitis]
MALNNTALKELRKEKKLTQTELASKLDISQKSYSNWESGKAEPTLDNIIKLANILDTTTDFLLGRTNIDFGNDSKVYEEYKELFSQNKKEEIKERYDHSFEFFIKAVAKQLNISVEESLEKIISDIGNKTETNDTK